MEDEHEGLEVEISRCCCGELEVRILDSPVDRPRERLEIVPARLAALHESVERYDGLITEASTSGQRARRELAREIGIDLFRLLTPGRVGASLREALRLLDRVRAQGGAEGRLRVSFGAGRHYDPEIASLPWELICDPEGGSRFLGSDPQTQVVRYLDVTRTVRPLEVDPPLRVLAVLASPGSQPAIDLDAQELRLLRAVHGAVGRIELRRLRPPTLAALRETLLAAERRGEPFHVVHFLGHGELAESGDGELYFEREDRRQHRVRGEVLAAQLAAFRDLRLVVLASCEGARLPRRRGCNPFTGSAAALIAANFPAVVAMQFTVTAEAAAAFTSGFYDRLGAGGSVIEAVAEGRMRMITEDSDGSEWATPVLFLRPADGRVLQLRTDGERRRRPAGNVSVGVRSRRIRVGRDLSVVGVAGEPGTASQPAATEVSVEADDLRAKRDVKVAGSQPGGRAEE